MKNIPFGISIFFLILNAFVAESKTLAVPGDFQTIQKAVDAASAEGDTVLVAPGTYKENIRLERKCITIASHFIVTKDTTLIYQTVLQQAERKPVIYAWFGVEWPSRIIGFTIINNGNSGIRCIGTSPQFSYLRIIGGVIDIESGKKPSPGIYCSASNSPMDHVLVCDNPGGGIYVSGVNGRMEFSDVIVTRNFQTEYFSSDELVGGIRGRDGNGEFVIKNSFIYNNSRWGVRSSIKTRMENCLIFKNQGSGINMEKAAEISHCTISGNAETGISIGSQYTLILKNSILSDNATDISIPNSSVEQKLENCLIRKNTLPSNMKLGKLVKVNANGDSCDVFSNIFMNPSFVNPSAGNYHLNEYSPAIGAAQGGITEYDIEGNKRGFPPDIGAYDHILDNPNRNKITVSGRVLLNGSQNSAGACIIFTNADTQEADSVFSARDGSYLINLVAGLYVASFSCPLFVPRQVYSLRIISGPFQVPEVILLKRTANYSFLVPAEFQTIQQAMDQSAPGDTVLVQPGLYQENIDFKGKKNIVVGSLFVTTGDTSYISQTVIDGGKKGRVIFFSGGEDSTTVLAGFTLANGMLVSESGSAGIHLHGAGILCLNSTPKLDHLIIKENHIYGIHDAGGVGGGLYCDNSSPIIENTIFDHNSALDGAGIYCINHSNPRMTNIMLFGNFSGLTQVTNGGISGMVCSNDSNPFIVNMEIKNGLGGGGFACINSSPIIRKLTIDKTYSCGFQCSGSSSPTINDFILKNVFSLDGIQGRGIRCSGGSPVFTNVRVSSISFIGILCEGGSKPTFINAVIDNIRGDSPKSVYCNYSSPIFINSTITKPYAGGQYWMSSGVYSKANSKPRLINTIITDHTYGIHYDGGSASVMYSNIWNSKLANFYNAPDSLGVLTQVNARGDSCDAFFNINKDPKFIDGYKLSSSSPCIGAGTAEDAPEFDIVGVRRHNPPDMGAYEFDRPIGVVAQAPIPFALLQNHPNPFNPSTTITFTLPQPGFVTLAIYNAAGQKVRTLFSGSRPAGTHSVVWDGNNDSGKPVSSGLYLSRLDMGGKAAVNRMLLLK